MSSWSRSVFSVKFIPAVPYTAGPIIVPGHNDLQGGRLYISVGTVATY
jgi:hypothetical protein